ncbi:MAG TPA: hypothetical protein VGE77_01760 [Nocardioides sp.]
MSSTDEIEVPADAGEYADALAAILRRIPEHWGRWIDCQKGWYPILARLDTDLAALDAAYEVHQVKEKFGGLRYYTHTEKDGVRERFETRIQQAEQEAYRTCELCGTAGSLAKRGTWYQTLCGACATASGFDPVGGN